MKYRKEEGAVIRFSAEERKEQTILGIWDNGIGIRPEEIGRVFEKGFTGEVNIGTNISTIFPKAENLIET